MTRMSVASNSLVFAGGGLDTGNLGVGALTLSVLFGLLGRAPVDRITVLDHSARCEALSLPGCPRDKVQLCGSTWSRYPTSAYCQNLACFGAVTGLPLGPTSRALLQCDALLDISGGDSFTDMYGDWRYRKVCQLKRLGLRLRKPLILLPQTYGPFKSPDAQALARSIVRGTTMAWARDERSFQTLCELAGPRFDPSIHRAGVDVAFLLPTEVPDLSVILNPCREWLEGPDPSEPLAGVNVSGLIYNDPQRARERFGFKADYAAVIHGFVEGLAERGARVILIPHVVTPPGHFESDTDAAARVAQAIRPALRERVAVAPPFNDPREVKWLIGRCDWFCGTRMHATIAGLSQGVPTAAIAYSIKTQGVFETCGQGAQVADPRQSGTDEVVDHLLRSFEDRADARASLSHHLPQVRAVAEEQMDAVVECVTNLASGGPATQRG